MLLTKTQMKYLQPDGEEHFKFVDDGTASKQAKQDLLDLDADYYEVYQQHIITNYGDLNK